MPPLGRDDVAPGRRDPSASEVVGFIRVLNEILLLCACDTAADLRALQHIAGVDDDAEHLRDGPPPQLVRLQFCPYRGIAKTVLALARSVVEVEVGDGIDLPA